MKIQHCQTARQARSEIISDYDTSGLPWREFALLGRYAGIPAGTLCAIYNGDEIPKKWYKQLNIKDDPRERFPIYKDIAHLDNTIQSMTNQMDRRVLAVLVWRLARELGYTLEVNDE